MQTQLLFSEPIFDVRVVRDGGAMTLGVHQQGTELLHHERLATWVGASSAHGWRHDVTGIMLHPVDRRGTSSEQRRLAVLRLSTGGTGIYTFVSSADGRRPRGRRCLTL